MRSPKSEIRPSLPGSLLLLFWSANVVLAYGNPASPRGRGTVPPSSYRSSLVNLPSPVDNANNRVVTGNVGGGRHFRSSVPYGSTTSFGAPLGSTSLDPFLRYSAIPEELNDGPSTGSLFHSPTGSVSIMQPGAGGVFAPGSPRIAGAPMQMRPDQPADLDTFPTPEVTPSGAATGYRSISNAFLSPPGYSRAALDDGVPRRSRTSEEMRRLILGEPGDPATDRRPLVQAGQVMTPDEYRRQVDQLQEDFDRVRSGVSSFAQDFRTGPSVPGPMRGTPATDAVLPAPSAEALRSIIQPHVPGELLDRRRFAAAERYCPGREAQREDRIPRPLVVRIWRAEPGRRRFAGSDATVTGRSTGGRRVGDLPGIALWALQPAGRLTAFVRVVGPAEEPDRCGLPAPGDGHGRRRPRSRSVRVQAGE